MEELGNPLVYTRKSGKDIEFRDENISLDSDVELGQSGRELHEKIQIWKVRAKIMLCSANGYSKIICQSFQKNHFS